MCFFEKVRFFIVKHILFKNIKNGEIWVILYLRNTKYEMRKDKEEMKKNIKKTIGNIAINLGKYAVGKSIVMGMYDPKIPDILKINNKERK